MANTLTALAPVLYSAARVVPRELVGMVGAVKTDFDAKGVAKGDTVTIGVAPVQTVADVTPAQTFTVGTDRTATSKVLTLNQFKETSFNLTPEQERSLLNSGIAQDFLQQTIQQSIRALVNSMETYVSTVGYKAASRSYGTAGTTPFGSNFNEIANLRKILDDNGSPVMGDRSLVINTAAGANMRNLSSLYQVYSRGSDATLAQGVLLDIEGFKIRESAQIQTPTKGTGASYTTNNAGYAVGATAITLITGSGTILAGDTITISGDTNKYVVATALTGGVVTIQEPGLLQAIPASATAVTVGNTAAQNLAFDRNAIVLVARPALQPEGALAEQMVISDPVTGLSFLLLRVPGNAITSWYLRVVYDSFAPNPYAIATLLG